MGCSFWLDETKERDHLNDLGVEGRIILKLILSRMGGSELGLFATQQVPVLGISKR